MFDDSGQENLKKLMKSFMNDTLCLINPTLALNGICQLRVEHYFQGNAKQTIET